MTIRQYQNLIEQFAARDAETLERVKKVQAVLADATVRDAKNRIRGLMEANGKSPVVQRGRFEWHYAAPFTDRAWAQLGASVPLPDYPLDGCSIAAVDGSQIFPDPRDRYPFALIRVGEIAINYGSDRRPVTRQIIYGPDEAVILDALIKDMTAGERNALIGGYRDRLEMQHAQRIVADLEDHGARVVLLDGPLHPFYPSETVAQAHDAAIAAIVAAGAVPCGVVSGGDASYVVRLAGLLENISSDDDWPRVTDRLIFADLRDGEMSQDFVIVSSYNALAVCPIGFAYIRTGAEIVRVEFPAIPAVSAGLLRALRAIWNDSRTLDYPYTLLKAHNLAVIHAAERKAYQERFASDLAAFGLYDDSRSTKERLKEIA